MHVLHPFAHRQRQSGSGRRGGPPGGQRAHGIGGGTSGKSGTSGDGKSSVKSSAKSDAKSGLKSGLKSTGTGSGKRKSSHEKSGTTSDGKRQTKLRPTSKPEEDGEPAAFDLFGDENGFAPREPDPPPTDQAPYQGVCSSPPETTTPPREPKVFSGGTAWLANDAAKRHKSTDAPQSNARTKSGSTLPSRTSGSGKAGKVTKEPFAPHQAWLQ